MSTDVLLSSTRAFLKRPNHEVGFSLEVWLVDMVAKVCMISPCQAEAGAD